MSINPGSLALFVAVAQLDATAAVLKDATARIEAAKLAAAQAAEQETARAAQQSEQASERAPEQDNPNRVVTLVEASRLSSLSKNTILRNHRDKLIQLSERRLGMRLGDALNLSCKEN